METLDELVTSAINDFRQVAALAGVEFIADTITVEITAKPHKSPSKLPAGMIAVYAFFLDGHALKVGKVGQKSAARYTSQHYNAGSAMSTLAASILTNARRVGAEGIYSPAIGDWIRTHTDRVNLLMPISLGLPMLSLLESFLHVRWKPVFEGKPESE
jgi:hypothetical protein